MGSEIVAITMELAFDSLDAPPERIAGAEIPMPYAINLERQALPSVRNTPLPFAISLDPTSWGLVSVHQHVGCRL